MEIYDYRNGDADISEEIDSFTSKQRKQLADAIGTIKRESEEEQVKHWTTWFDNAILSALKNFAELTGSILEVSRDKQIIEVIFRSVGGIDITESCLCMKVALIASVHISIGVKNDESLLTLIYDCKKLID